MIRIRCMLNLISHFTTTSLALSNEKLTRSRSVRQSNCLQIRQVKLYCVSGLHHKRSLLADKKKLQGFAICTTSRITQTVSFCNWTRTDGALVAGTWIETKKCILVDLFWNWQMMMCRLRIQKLKIGHWGDFEKIDFFSFFLMRKRLSSGQKWFLRP